VLGCSSLETTSTFDEEEVADTVDSGDAAVDMADVAVDMADVAGGAAGGVVGGVVGGAPGDLNEDVLWRVGTDASRMALP
jgi:hypothetical protein